ncbi:MAG TPA: glycosyltransferase, partial [Rubrobacter sp.]|nr:glycosyltransferase [Rubrobacter sp.]
MRILFAAHQFFPEHRAGTEVLTLWLARALRARGHEAAVFAAKRSAPFTDLRPGETEDYVVEGVPVRRIGRPEESLSRPYRLNYDNPRMAEGMREAVSSFRPDVVHFMHLQGLSAGAIPVVKEEFGLPALYTAT